MQMHKTSRFSIFFGDEATSFVPQEFYGCQDEAEIRNSEQFRAVAQALQLESLVVIMQTHGTAGITIQNLSDVPAQPYAIEGDYLVTSLPGVGLAIATADCLPIVFYDPVQHTIAAIHAGWRGSVQGIAAEVVRQMQQSGSNAVDLQIFFGPSAGVCCYEVDEPFVQGLPEAGPYLVHRAGRIYFDNLLYNKLQLTRKGVRNFKSDYWRCTICSPGFCSYRRDGKASKRQMTIVALNSI